MFQKKYLIGQELVRLGKVSQDDLDFALIQHEKTGKLLGQILVRCGFVSENDFFQVLADQLDMPVVKILEIEVPQDLIDTVPVKLIREVKIIPAYIEENSVVIACAYPPSLKIKDKIAQYFDLPVKYALDSDVNILKAIKKYYGITNEEDLELLDEEGM